MDNAEIQICPDAARSHFQCRRFHASIGRTAMTHAHTIHKQRSLLADIGHVLGRVLRTSPASDAQERPRWGSYMVRYL
jgi:hypothetical protein